MKASSDQSQLQMQLPDGRSLGFAEFGDADGAPILYFHGFPGSRLDWRVISAANVPVTGKRIIAVDRPGCGLSDPQSNRTMLGWAGDVASLANELGFEQFAVLGVSGGGPYALACASALPDRVTRAGVVCGMGPSDAPGARDGASWTIPKMMWPMRRIILFLTALGIRKDPDKFVSQSKDTMAPVDAVLLDEPEVADAFVAALAEAFRSGTAGPAAEAALYKRPWGFSLEDIEVPVHLWHGDLDMNVAISVGRHVAASIPGCRATFLEGEAHLTLPRNHGASILDALVG